MTTQTDHNGLSSYKKSNLHTKKHTTLARVSVFTSTQHSGIHAQALNDLIMLSTALETALW